MFDFDWTPNGWTLLSAGGDGTCRIWDTRAVGPYDRLSNVTQQRGGAAGGGGSHPRHAGRMLTDSLGGTNKSSSSMFIPGAKPEPLVEIGGAALSVYRGHAPGTPIWSVSAAPSGYYFASAGSDCTARIWSTDRCAQLRILAGHAIPSVNCVSWHPNCNLDAGSDGTDTRRPIDASVSATATRATSHAAAWVSPTASAARSQPAASPAHAAAAWPPGLPGLLPSLPRLAAASWLPDAAQRSDAPLRTAAVRLPVSHAGI